MGGHLLAEGGNSCNRDDKESVGPSKRGWDNIRLCESFAVDDWRCDWFEG
jgi:hypothetical protein